MKYDLITVAKTGDHPNAYIKQQLIAHGLVVTRDGRLELTMRGKMEAR